MSGRYSQLLRSLSILKRLEHAPQGLTAPELHQRLKDEFHIGVRTVYRDLDALEELGLLVHPDNSSRAGDDAAVRRWKVAGQIKEIKPGSATYRTLLVLYLVTHLGMPEPTSPLAGEAKAVLDRLLAGFDQRSRSFLKALPSQVCFSPDSAWGRGIDINVLETVHCACEQEQVLSVVYNSAVSRTQRRRRLGPHFIYFSRGTAYLIAEDLEVPREGSSRLARLKVFSIARMSESELLTDAYARSPSSGLTEGSHKAFDIKTVE